MLVWCEKNVPTYSLHSKVVSLLIFRKVEIVIAYDEKCRSECIKITIKR
jgi:hypothetical protein